MQCAAYFASIAGYSRTVLLTCDVASRVISAGNGINVENAVPYRQYCGDRGKDPLDVLQFLLSHDKMDASLIAEDWMPCQDAVLMLRMAKLHGACRRECHEEVHGLVNRGLLSLKQVLVYAFQRCNAFALSYVMERREEVIGMPFDELVERALDDLSEPDPLIIEFFNSFTHSGNQGFPQGLVGLAKRFPFLI